MTIQQMLSWGMKAETRLSVHRPFRHPKPTTAPPVTAPVTPKGPRRSAGAHDTLPFEAPKKTKSQLLGVD